MAATVSLLMPDLAHAISGGTGTSQPWAVQILRLTNQPVCSGVAINELMVVTAKHCSAESVLYPDGGVGYVAGAHEVPGSDVQVLVLSGEHPLDNYPALGPDYIALGQSLPAGTAGTIYGYGSGPEDFPQRSLRVVLNAHGTLQNDNTVDQFYLLERNGQSEHGDSGGPLLIDGKLMGIYRGAGNTADGQKILVAHGMSKALAVIRRLEHSREMRSIKEQGYYPGPWISAVNVAKGKLSVTMSSQLINSGKTVTIWINGKYAGHVKNDISYYCSKTNFSGGSIVSPGTPVKEGDLVQIGIVTNVDSPDGSELLYEKRFNGIESVMLRDGHAVIRMSTTLVNSGQRLIVWLNGAYATEVHKGVVYYGGRADGDGTVTVYSGAATPTTLVQIGVVAGNPGGSIGTPAGSKLLYDATVDGKPGTLTPQPGEGEWLVDVVNLP